ERLPESKGFASIRAAATPSRTARLTPTPPSGDIACAASPMHSKPYRCHLVSRFILISKHLTSSHVNSLSDCLVAGTAREVAERNCGEPACRRCLWEPFGMMFAICAYRARGMTKKGFCLVPAATYSTPKTLWF